MNLCVNMKGDVMFVYEEVASEKLFWRLSLHDRDWRSTRWMAPKVMFQPSAICFEICLGKPHRDGVSYRSSFGSSLEHIVSVPEFFVNSDLAAIMARDKYFEIFCDSQSSPRQIQ